MKVNSLFNVPGSRKPRKGFVEVMVAVLVELVAVVKKGRNLVLVLL
jgi:hypothetical protein